jgi:uncharacterized protein (TIGR02271 family)
MNSQQKTQNPNRDPLTGEPRSHPVGTGVGAVSGGAAGAAAGAAAGPIGAGVGAAAGAAIRAAAGHAVGEHYDPTTGGDLGRYIDYTVIDREGDKVGSVDAVWEDHAGEPSYLAVRTGWLGLGKAHVVPAQAAEVNERARKIRLPYTADQIRSGPSFDSQSDITTESEFTISSHFGLPPRRQDDGLAPRARAQGDARVELKSEDVKVGKREVEYGGIRLRKIVRTETVNQPVELSREEVVIERVPLEGRDVAQEGSFAEEEVYVPLRREEPVVEKTVRAREEVRVGKRTETEHRDVRESVRREDVEIEREGAVRNSDSVQR